MPISLFPRLRIAYIYGSSGLERKDTLPTDSHNWRPQVSSIWSWAPTTNCHAILARSMIKNQRIVFMLYCEVTSQAARPSAFLLISRWYFPWSKQGLFLHHCRLGAILSTHGLQDTHVVRMETEDAALRKWREEVSLGILVDKTGTMIEEEVRKFQTQIAARLMKKHCSEIGVHERSQNQATRGGVC